MKQIVVSEKTGALRILYAVIFIIAVITLRDFHFYGLTFQGWLLHDFSPFALGGMIGLLILHWAKPSASEGSGSQSRL